MASKTHFLSLLSLILLIGFSLQSNQDQLHFLSLLRDSVLAPSLLNWPNFEDPNTTSSMASSAYCNFEGVLCDTFGSIMELNFSGRVLGGLFPANACHFLPELHTLKLGGNWFHGDFPVGIVNCSLLEELNLTMNHFSGQLPDLSPLTSLKVLDLSYNQFSGEFPVTVSNLTNLEVLNFNMIPKFFMRELPQEITRLTKIRKLILSTCGLVGQIPASLANLSELQDLELSGNHLVGQIPAELGRLKNLQLLELYYNQLSGSIPKELGNLTNLRDLDISVNKLTGNIPEEIFRLPNLASLQLYNNCLTGKIPEAIGNSTSLMGLSLYENYLTGELPPGLGEFSNFILLDVSENQLSGQLPAKICSSGNLQYFLALNNKFSGGLPESYTNCKKLLRFRVSNNSLSGKIVEGFWELPHISIIDLAFNGFEGSIPPNIQTAKNLSELYLQNNQFSSEIPPQISGANNLVKLDLSGNLLNGSIPQEIGKLTQLNLLLLQKNNLVGAIPDSLSALKMLNVLNLSNNLLTGKVPESLFQLLPNSLDFSNNRLSGTVPLAIVRGGIEESLAGNPDICIQTDSLSALKANIIPPCQERSKKQRLHSFWVILVSIIALFIGILLFFRRWFRREKVVVEIEASSSVSSFLWDVKSFHKLNFDQHEILESLNEKNVIGHGGSGTVYRIQLKNGEAVAVKKLWTKRAKNQASDIGFIDRELEAEVKTLGSIRHKNIVKLYCCFSNPYSNLLVYQYMPNGNLWDALHKGTCLLDWPARHRIALGIAQGLSYLHHDLSPPIIHRDIKSTNILLDADFQPKVADFGVAKVLQSRGSGDSITTTAIAGTYGYLAPEYAYSSKATTKCDVYSYGVLLMELITGKKPVEAEFGENKNIVYWISKKVATKEGTKDVLDKQLAELFTDDMVKALRISVLCTNNMPAYRPKMNEVVQMLIEADPARGFNAFKSEAIKVKSPSE